MKELQEQLDEMVNKSEGFGDMVEKVAGRIVRYIMGILFKNYLAKKLNPKNWGIFNK